jgi:hypothetical protein
MTRPRRVCLDLTPSETHDRFGGFTRYGLALLEHLLALPAGERAGIELLVLARSDGTPVPAEQIDPEALLAAPIVPIDRHCRQRRRLVGGALRSALGLPMRGIVRWISGADRRAKVHARAVLAGIARRSFLKGVARTSCPVG